MITFLKNLFGGAGTANDAVKAGMRGIDALIFTDQEKSAVNEKFREWMLRYYEATQPQNIARRLIAVIVVMLWALMNVAAIITYFFDPEASKFIFQVIHEVINAPFITIIGFYFLTHSIRAIKGTKE